MNKVVNGVVVEIPSGSAEESALLAEWADNAPDAGAKWLADQAAMRDKLRSQAAKVFAASDGDPEPLPKAVRALALVMLDEINLLRAAAGLPARTAAQLKTAVRNRIDAGDADG